MTKGRWLRETSNGFFLAAFSIHGFLLNFFRFMGYQCKLHKDRTSVKFDILRAQNSAWHLVALGAE